MSASSSFPLVTKIFHSADGTPLYAQSRGHPSKPCVVFLHATSFSSIIWSQIFDDPRWYNELFLVSLDLRGHGQSGKPTESKYYETKRFADDFDAIVQGFNLVKPFVFGWGFGGTILADILTFHPTSYISGWLLVGGAPSMDSLPEISRPDGVAINAHIALPGSVEEYRKGVVNFIQTQTHTSSYSIPYPLYPALVGTVLLRPLSCALRMSDRTHEIRGLRTAAKNGLPLLIIHGRHDMFLNGEEVESTCKEYGWKNAKVTWLDCGHIPFLEKQDEVREEVLKFIASSVSAAGN
ncbi:AB hydrolase superfamily protein [Abortiporus biennis]